MATVTRHPLSPELAERFEREVLPYRPSLRQSAFRLTHHVQDAEDPSRSWSWRIPAVSGCPAARAPAGGDAVGGGAGARPDACR